MSHWLSAARAAQRRSWIVSIALLFAGIACAPRAGALRGAPTPVRFPITDIPRGHQRVLFRWDYVDQALAAKGEGIARIAAPDSVRLDFYLDGGLGGGFAIVIGDSISTPGGDQVRRYLPPDAPCHRYRTRLPRLTEQRSGPTLGAIRCGA